jgi:hypothetical protein
VLGTTLGLSLHVIDIDPGGRGGDIDLGSLHVPESVSDVGSALDVYVSGRAIVSNEPEILASGYDTHVELVSVRGQ